MQQDIPVLQEVYQFLSYILKVLQYVTQSQALLSYFEHATADLSHTLSAIIYSDFETSEVTQRHE